MANAEPIVEGQYHSIVGQAEQVLRDISQSYFVIFDGPWLIENTQKIPNPDPELRGVFKNIARLEIKEPAYLRRNARHGMGGYNQFANTLGFDSWLLGDDEMRREVHVHELAHALQQQYNKRLVREEWKGINKKRSDNPLLAGLLDSFGEVGTLLKLPENREDDYFLRLYNAIGEMLYLFVPRKRDRVTETVVLANDKLTEGFAEWMTAKVLPCRVNSNEREKTREEAFRTFLRLEERLGEARTLGIALTAESDAELAAITSQYL